MSESLGSIASPYIAIENLQKWFKKGDNRIDVLKGLNLKLEQGDTLAIVGESGAGKSTMIHILGGLEKPSAGTILYSGKDIYSMKARELAFFRNREIGLVFQFHQLLPEFSALENVMIPALIARMSRKESSARAADLLDKVGLSHRLKHKPGELSGGEQQRVAIARALVMKPKVIIADEPTGNLDSKTSDEITTLINDLNIEIGITIIMVTHNEKLASKMGKKILVRDGRLIS